MKLVIAQMKHETNTFSPVPTPLSRFAVGAEVPPHGEAAVAAYRGTGSAIAAFALTEPDAGSDAGAISTRAMRDPGGWRIDGEKLCTVSAMGGGSENCIAYPAGKKPGDEFKVTNPMLGEVTVKINKYKI